MSRAAQIKDNRELSFRYGAVDLTKLILAFLVIAIHYPLTDSYEFPFKYILMHWFTCVAVPYFFIASGFFCFRKVDLDSFDISITLKTAWKITKLYAIWALVYLLPQLAEAIIERTSIIAFFGLFFRRFLLEGYGQLWYLKALAIAIVLISLMLKFGVKKEWILAVSFVFYLIGLLGQSYAGLIESNTLLSGIAEKYYSIFSTTRNGLFDGFMFVSLGLIASKVPVKLEKKTNFALFCTAMLLFFVELIVVRKYNLVRENATYLSLIPASWFLFRYTAAVPGYYPRRYLQYRDISALLFYSHIMVGGVVMQALSSDVNSIIRYLTVTSVSIFVSLVIIWTSKRIPMLKHLY